MDSSNTQKDLHLCKWCHRSVEKPCVKRETQNNCGQSVSKTRGGGAGEKTISFDTPSFVSFHTIHAQVVFQWQALVQMGKDPLQAFTRKKREELLKLEAERRFIDWQKATRKNRPWYEVLKIPLKGSKHEIRVVRKFRDQIKAGIYIDKRTKKAEGAASFQMQTRNGVAPLKPKELLGFDPNQQKESIMAKAKAKVKAATNGAAKAPKVKKDKAYYMKAVSAPKTSGDFIRGRILQGKMTAEEIATETRKKFKGHTTKPSDVYWNRGQLKAAGIKVPEMGAGK